MEPVFVDWTREDRESLAQAHALLEHKGLAERLTQLVGAPVERGLAMLPAGWRGGIQKAVTLSLEKALDVALMSMRDPARKPSRERWHTLAVALTGAGGGAFGLPGLAVELPASTTLMLRSIAEIARSEGEDLSSLEGRLECLKVFALGGGRAEGESGSGPDGAAETGYYAVRSAMAAAVRDAVQFVAEHGVAEKGAPVLVRLIAAIASRFGVVVSEKAAAMAIPAVGAFGGAVVNTLFMDHFQGIARGHFIIRRLERTHGKDRVRAAYRSFGGR